MLPAQNTSADRLRAFKSERALTQRALADELGCARGFIGDILQGRQEPSREFARKMLAAYGVSANWLLFGVGPMLIEKNSDTS